MSKSGHFKRISTQDEMEYRANDFYDMDDMDDVLDFSPLYQELSSLDERYSDKEELASGGMKTIYKVFDRKAGRHVAMAQLHENSPEELYEPFIREARLTSALEHPNIIKVHDIAIQKNGIPFFTMELKVGDSLAEIIRKRGDGNKDYLRYSQHDLLTIFLKVCDAIAFSHSRHVLHLDLKPENIQVGDYGEVLVCDWGLGKISGKELQSDEDLLLNPDLLNNITMSGEIKGTPGFMAPEQVIKNGDKTQRTDIYALGATLYSILTDKAPYEGDVKTILEKTKKGELISPIKRCPDRKIPESLNAVVEKAMALNQGDRYQSVSKLRDDVNNYIQGYSTVAEEAKLWKEITLFYNRNKALCFSSAISISILMIVMSISIFYLDQSWSKERDARRIADQNYSDAETNRLAAEKSKHEAIQAQVEAEKNLQKYKFEKEITDLSLSKSATAILQDMRKKYWIDFHDDPGKTMDDLVVILNRVGEAKINDNGFYIFKAEVHFVRQEFDLALNALADIHDDKSQRFNLLKESLLSVKTYKSNGQKTAPLNVVETAIRNLQGEWRQTVGKLVILDKARRQHLSEHVEVVKYGVKNRNPKWQFERFIYEPETKTLRLSGNCHILSGYFHMAQKHVSIFSTLDVDVFDIQGLVHLSPEHLEYMDKLKLLDARSVYIHSDELAKYVSEVYISKHLINPKVLKSIESKIKVTVYD